MNSSFSGNLDAIDYSNCMVQLCAVLLKPAFYGLSPMGHVSIRGRNKLHERRHKRQQVVTTLVSDLTTAIRNAARLVLHARHDLARVHRILHERRADEHGRSAICIREWRVARSLDAGEGEGRGRRTGGGHPQGNAVAGRRYLGHDGLYDRGRGWAVTRGWRKMSRGWRRRFVLLLLRIITGGTTARSAGCLAIVRIIMRLVAARIRRKLGGFGGRARGGIDAAAALRRSHSKSKVTKPKNCLVDATSWGQRGWGVCGRGAVQTWIPRTVVLGLGFLVWSKG